MTNPDNNWGELADEPEVVLDSNTGLPVVSTPDPGLDPPVQDNWATLG